MRKPLAVCTVAVLVCLLGVAEPAVAAGAVEGAGSSFPQLEIEQWRSDVAKKPYSLKINYVSSGSTFGRQQFIQNSVDFAVSDIAFQADELPQVADRSYTFVTISAGGVGFMYNLRDASGKRIGVSAANGGNDKPLKLSARTACRIFSEPGMRWNDAEMQADNPDIQLPNKAISPVFRADPSGPGFAVQEYCIATAPDVWQAFLAHVARTPALAQAFAGDPFLAGMASPRWPVFAGQAAFAGDGVANVVASSEADGSITYVEAGFAEVRGYPNAFVRNAAGVYHYPESTNVNIALKYARRNADATVTLDYVTQDPDVYFPSSYSYAIVPTAGIDAGKGKDLAAFLNYAVTAGQEKADRLGYAPLSKEIVDISLNEIVKIPGAPPKPTTTSVTPPVITIGACYDGSVGSRPTTGRFTYRSETNVAASAFAQNAVEATDQGVPFATLIGDSTNRLSHPYTLPAGAQDRLLWTIAGRNAAGFEFGPLTARLESTNTTITDANRCNLDSDAPPFEIPEAPVAALLTLSAATTIGATHLIRRRRARLG